MRRVLHILSQPDDLAREFVARQKEDRELQVIVVDLTASDADYDKLLEEIFRADSIQSW